MCVLGHAGLSVLCVLYEVKKRRWCWDTSIRSSSHLWPKIE